MIRSSALEREVPYEQQANFHYSIPSQHQYTDPEVVSYQQAASAMSTTGNPPHSDSAQTYTDATGNNITAANPSHPVHPFNNSLASSILPREKLSALHRQAVQIVDEWSQWKTAHRDNVNPGLAANASSARPTSASTRAYTNNNNEQYSWRPSSARTFSQTQPSSAAPARSTLHIIGMEDEATHSQSRSPLLQPHPQPQFDPHRIGEKHLYDATPSETSSRSSFMPPAAAATKHSSRTTSDDRHQQRDSTQQHRRSNSRSRSRSPSTTHSSRSHSHSPRGQQRRSKDRQQYNIDDDEMDMKEEKRQRSYSRSSRSRSTSRSPRANHSAEAEEEEERSSHRRSHKKAKKDKKDTKSSSKSSKRIKGESKKHHSQQEVVESTKDRRSSSSHDSHRSSSPRRSRSRSTRSHSRSPPPPQSSSGRRRSTTDTSSHPSLDSSSSHRDRSYSPRSRSRSRSKMYDDEEERSYSRSLSRPHRPSSKSPEKARFTPNHLQPDVYSRSERVHMTSPGRFTILPHHADSAALSVNIDEEYGNSITDTFSPNRSQPLNPRAVAARQQQQQQQQQHFGTHQPFQQYADALELMKIGGRQMVTIPYHQPKRIHLIEENYPPVNESLGEQQQPLAYDSAELNLVDPLASHELSSPTHHSNHHHLSVHQSSSAPSALSPGASRYLLTSPNGITSTIQPSSLTLNARRIAHDNSISLALRKRAAALAAASERLQVEEYNVQQMNSAYDVDYPAPRYEQPEHQEQLVSEEMEKLQQQEEERQIREVSRQEQEALLFSQLRGLQQSMQLAESGGENYNGMRHENAAMYEKGDIMSPPANMQYRRSPAADSMRTPQHRYEPHEQEQLHTHGTSGHDARTPPRSRPRSHSPASRSHRRRSLSPRAGATEARSGSRSSPAHDAEQPYEQHHHSHHYEHDSAEQHDHHRHHQHHSIDARPHTSPEHGSQGRYNDSNRPYDTSRSSYEHSDREKQPRSSEHSDRTHSSREHDHHDAEVKYRISVSSADDNNSPSSRLSPRVSPRASSRPSTADSTARDTATTKSQTESSPSHANNENRSLSPQNVGSNLLRPSRTQTVKELRTSIIVQQMQLQALMRQQQREHRKMIVEEEKQGEVSPIKTNPVTQEASAALATATKPSVKVEDEPYSSLHDPLSLDYDFDLPDVSDSWPTSPIHTGHTPPVGSGKSGSRRVSRRASLVSTAGLGQLSLEQQVEQYLEKQKQAKASEVTTTPAVTAAATVPAVAPSAIAAVPSTAASGVDPVVSAPLSALSSADLDRLDAEARAARRARRAERERRQALKQIEEQQKAVPVTGVVGSNNNQTVPAPPSAALPGQLVPPAAGSPDSAAYVSAYYAQWAQSIWQQMQQQVQASHGANASVMQRPEYQQAYAAYINAYLSQLQRAGYPIQSSAFINLAATTTTAKPVAPVPISSLPTATAPVPLHMTAPVSTTNLPPPSLLPQLIQQERAEAALRREVRDKRRAANFIKQYGLAAAQAVGLAQVGGDTAASSAAGTMYPPPPSAPFPVAPLAATAPAASAAAHHVHPHRAPNVAAQPAAAFVPQSHTYPPPASIQHHHAAPSFLAQPPVRVHKVSQTPLFVLAPNAPVNASTVSPSQPTMVPTPPRKSRPVSAGGDASPAAQTVRDQSRNSGGGSRAARIAARTAAVQQSRGKSASSAKRQQQQQQTSSFSGLPSKRPTERSSTAPMYTAQERNEKERQQQPQKPNEPNAKSNAKASARPSTSGGVNNNPRSSSNSHASSKEASRRLYREHSFASRASLHTSEEEDWSSEEEGEREDDDDGYSSLTASNDDSRYHHSRRRSDVSRNQDYDQRSAAASSEVYSDEQPKPRSSNTRSSVRSPARAQGRTASDQLHGREAPRSRERQVQSKSRKHDAQAKKRSVHDNVD